MFRESRKNLPNDDLIKKYSFKLEIQSQMFNYRPPAMPAKQKKE